MYKTYLFVFSLFLLLACNDNNIDRDTFTKTYQEILIARESIQDTAKANKEVEQILQNNGYDFKKFKKDYFDLVSSDRDWFMKMVDTIRKRARALRYEPDTLQTDTLQTKAKE